MVHPVIHGMTCTIIHGMKHTVIHRITADDIPYDVYGHTRYDTYDHTDILLNHYVLGQTARFLCVSELKFII